jgi:transcriptional antiterminator RfaH
MAEQAALEWYVVRSKLHQEYSVESGLSRAGIEVFCPRIREEKRIRRKMQSVIAPLFPGYLFARFCLSRSRVVMYARGVRTLVSFGHAPAIVQPEIIDGIRDRLQNGIVDLKDPSFNRGDVVRIREGPLCGLEAVFEEEMVGQQRAILLMKTLTCQVRVVLDLKLVMNL